MHRGARGFAERQYAAERRFLDYAVTHGLSEAEANRALEYYQRHKLVKLDPIGGQFTFVHGAFGDADALRKAAALKPNAERPPPPPPRPRQLDVKRRLSRLVHTQRPFNPEEPPMRYAKSHHFAVNAEPTQFKHLLFGTRFRFVNPGDAPSALGTFGEGFEYRKVDHKKCAVAIGDGIGRSKFHCAPNALVVPVYASNARREAGDEHAAEELILYLDNDSRFSPMGSGQGHSILVNMMRKWRNGTYDHERAPQGWSHVVEAAAKSYAKEFDSPRSWARIFTPATRDMVAQALADRFVAEAQSGELDYLDTSRR